MSPWINKGWEKAKSAGVGGDGEAGIAPSNTPFTLPFSTDVEGNIRALTAPAWVIPMFRPNLAPVNDAIIAFYRFAGYRRGIIIDSTDVQGMGGAYQLPGILPTAGWKIEFGWRGEQDYYAGFGISDVNDINTFSGIFTTLDNTIPQGALYISTYATAAQKDFQETLQGGQVPWERPTKGRITYTGATRTILLEHYLPNLSQTWTATIVGANIDVSLTQLRWLHWYASLNSSEFGPSTLQYIWIGALTADWPQKTVAEGVPS